MFSAFHFLRPEWFWAILPALFLGALIVKNHRSGASEGWARMVDSHLLKQLAIQGTAAKRSVWPMVAGAVMIASGILALAGPTWEERELPSYEGGEPVVVVLSLAQSMNADDLTPTRLKRSVHKLRDILERTKGDERGLVIYSDTAFIAAPLTSDAKVIGEVLPELSTTLMPVLGNRLDLAIEAAQGMLSRAGAMRGKIVVLADDAGNDPTAGLAAARTARRAGFTVSVLGAGTEEGATLQTADGRAIASRSGQTYMTKLAKSDLEAVAAAGDGAFSMITPGSADLDRILPINTAPQVAGQAQDFNADGWVDMGYWLLLLPALLAPFAFRKGLVFGLGLVMLGSFAQPNAAAAGMWDDLWATPNQQGQTAFEAGEYVEASELFAAPNWKGAAAYRAQNYGAAAVDFAGDNYNLGNALAKSGQFEQALAAYDEALEKTPSNADAQFNRDLIAKLLEEQEQQQQDQQNQEQSQQGQSQDQQDQSSGNGQQDQQSGEGAPQDQQSSDQQEGQQSDPQARSQGQKGSQDQAQQDAQDQGQDGKTSDQQPEGQTAQDQQPSGQPAGAQDQQPSEQADAAQEADDAQATDAGDRTAQESEATSLSDRLSDALGLEGEEPQEMVEAPLLGAVPEPINQAVEQQLRRVPDDPSGLLRARIRQHYARRK